MSPADWQQRYIDVSNELLWLAADTIRTGDDVTEREGELLDELDGLEMTAAAMVRAGLS